MSVLKGKGHESDRTHRHYTGCRMCKAHKHGGQPAKKGKEIARLRAMAKAIDEAMADLS